jgi:chromosome segregation ATPase
MLKSSRDEDQRKRDEAQFYTIQQQLDELRRQLRENLARQQWFEELYKQNEGKVSQMQIAQDRLAQDVAQALHARQIDEGRTKAQVAELVNRIEAPDKQIRELRSQISELAEARKTDRDKEAGVQRQIDEVHRQIREVNSHISQAAEAYRHLTDVMHELEATIGEVRDEALHIGELQRIEEQRLRRQGVELQEMFESLRQQFGEIAARSQRVDDVRKQLGERIERIEEQIKPIHEVEETLTDDLQRIESAVNEQYIAQQERLEVVRLQLESQVGEIRQLNDQRTDRTMSRFSQLEERVRSIDSALSELPSRFEALERRDEMIGSEADTIEEWLVVRQMAALEGILDDVRKRRVERADTIVTGQSRRPTPQPEAPGSVYNPSGLLRSVRDAKPPRKDSDGEIESEED